MVTCQTPVNKTCCLDLETNFTEKHGGLTESFHTVEQQSATMSNYNVSNMDVAVKNQ